MIVVTLYPFLNTVAVSFNDGLDSLKGGIYLWPRQFTTFNYTMLLGRSQTYQALKVTIARTVLSTVLGVFHSDFGLYYQ